MTPAIHTPKVQRQARRIRWQTGLSDSAAIVLAHLIYGEGRND